MNALDRDGLLRVADALFTFGDPWCDERLAKANLKTALAAYAYRRQVTACEAYEELRAFVPSDDVWESRIKPDLKQLQDARVLRAASPTEHMN